MSFKAYKEDGELLFDTNYISYGLRASGYLTLYTMGTRWYLRSAQLDPGDPSNYAETAPVNPIFGISVANCVAPIVFIEGQGAEMGSSTSGNVTTFLFQGAGPNTKAYVFDLMQDVAIGAGLKVYRDTPGNELCFNSAFVPLDVDFAYDFPPVPAEIPGWPRVVAAPFLGATAAWSNPSGLTSDPITTSLYTLKRFQAVGPYTYAAHITFSRSYGLGRQDNMGTPIEPGADRGWVFASSSSAQDGAYGAPGGFYYYSVNIANEAQVTANTFAAGGYWDVPRDRIPTVQVIRTDILPFPYNAF